MHGVSRKPVGLGHHMSARTNVQIERLRISNRVECAGRRFDRDLRSGRDFVLGARPAYSVRLLTRNATPIAVSTKTAASTSRFIVNIFVWVPLMWSNGDG
jgi:hypothetical protein